MSTDTALLTIGVLVLAAVVFLQDRERRRYLRERSAEREADNLTMANERQAWAVERQQLLDRIQAPSFAELKQAEVRTIKAQNGVKEPPPLEQL